MRFATPQDALRHHVSGAIARGEAVAIVEQPARIIPEGFESNVIRGYRLTVHRGARAGMVKEYKPAQRKAARRFADRLDSEYGAICASVSPIFSEA